MSHAIVKSRTARAPWFRTCWVKIDYACRDTATGSLLPVPPGTTRAKLYCGQCRAEKCLFTRRKPCSFEELEAQDRAEQERRHQRYLTDKARKRAQGLSTNYQPLKLTCWNCIQIRVKLAGYVCRHEPEADPAGREVMIHRYADGCQAFELRRVVEIPPLEIGD